LMFVALYAFALWATKRDPDMLRILLCSSRFKARYDAAKHQPFVIEVHSC
jgi:type IV secretory pathway TrbD component